MLSEMSASNRPGEDDKAWVAHWQRIGPKLDRIRREELRNFVYEDHLDLIDSLLEIGSRMGQPRTTSGLVEQQRLFQQARQESGQ